MVSRQTTRPLRKLVPAVAIGAGALLGIVGCGAGQVSQTAEMPPAVNGNHGQAGPIALRNVMVAFPANGEAYRTGEDAPLLLSIVNTGLADDELIAVTSPAGEVELTGNPVIPGGTSLRIVLPAENPAASTTETTESSGTESSTGTTEGSSSETSGTEASGTETTGGEAPSTEAPSNETSEATGTTESAAPESTEDAAAPVVGTMSLVITGLSADLPFGKTVPVTFEFANAGKVTIRLPVAAPSTPRPEPEAVEAEH